MARRVASLPRCHGEAEMLTIERRALLHEFVHGVGAVAALGPEVGVVPDVLADGEGDLLAAEFDGRDFLGGLEVAVLVEDVVGRQERLHHAMRDLAALDDGGGVVERAAGARGVAVDVAGDERDVADRFRKRVEALESARDEVVAQKQIAGRVAAEEQLGSQHQLGALAHRIFVGGLELGAVRVVRADGGVELKEGDAHG
jgi:hypothetical protein